MALQAQLKEVCNTERIGDWFCGSLKPAVLNLHLDMRVRKDIAKPVRFRPSGGSDVKAAIHFLILEGCGSGESGFTASGREQEDKTPKDRGEGTLAGGDDSFVGRGSKFHFHR